jgi:hypothetical protein
VVFKKRCKEELNIDSKEKLKTAVKIILCMFLFSGIFIAGMVIPCFFSTEVFMVFVGMIVASVILMALISYCLPRWFKGYIEYYWSKEGGVVSEDKNDKESNKEPSNTS